MKIGIEFIFSGISCFGVPAPKQAGLVVKKKLLDRTLDLKITSISLFILVLIHELNCGFYELGRGFPRPDLFKIFPVERFQFQLIADKLQKISVRRQEITD